MTQPPNHPPQGGFGAPQEQPPQGGGFGAPQTPPAPGGFGAPQSTPGAPGVPPMPPPPAQQPAAPPQQPQPGYGYPQQPGPYGTPGPYGYPPQQPGPYGAAPQPGFGHPQQPPYPGVPGAAPGGTPASRKKKTALITGAAVAALLVIGGAAYAVVSGDGGGKKKPVAQQSDDPKHSASGTPSPSSGGDDPENLNDGRKPGEDRVLWYKSAPDAPRSGAEAPGMWVTDKAVVKAAYKQVFAYGVGDGKPAWAPVSFPQKICAVTPQQSDDDKVVVAYMSGTSDKAECNQLQQIDLNTGQKGWNVKVDRQGAFDIAVEISLTISGKTVIAGRAGSAGTAYDVDSGKKLYDKGSDGGSCAPSGYAGGAGRLIQASSCAAFEPNEHDEIQELDPATGKVKWTQKVKKGWEVTKVYSLDPLVVYLTNSDKKAWNISTFGKDGKFRSQVKVDEKFAPHCGFLDRDLQGCQGVVTDADTLYLPTDSTSSANEIVAISLTTGKAEWRVKSPAAEPMYPMKTEGGKLVAYVQPSYDAGGQVVSIPTAGSSHKPTSLLQNPQGTAQIEETFFESVVGWSDGRFFISSGQLSGSDQAREKLIMAFGN
ncbi:PQQ-binding-like beta-propeller repeat protein [Streptomyces sp. NPDC007205]|uniref:outer membrane protein assembly factor BamB family protein n=1 Tax=Streptomyces sp. NPDC007205 TaxID=3154316 RepID=UPI0033CE8E92